MRARSPTLKIRECEPRRVSSRAFTLVELLVAAGITALLLSFVIVVLSQVLNTWAQTSGKLHVEAQARLVLDQLTHDLQGALFRDDGGVWLAATIPPDSSNSGLWVPPETSSRGKPGNGDGSLDLAPIAHADARHGIAGTWLRFFTTKRGSNSEMTDVSAPVVVGYQIVRRRSSGNPQSSDVRYLLHRAEVRPAQAGGRPGVLESGYNLDPGASPETRFMAASETNDGTRGDPRSLQVPRDLGCVIADNVIDFGVRLYVDVAGRATGRPELTRIFPETDADTEHLANAPSTTGPLAQRFPQVAEIMIRLLTEEGAKQIAALEQSPSQLLSRPVHFRSDAEWWWGIAEQHSHVFTRRVVIPVAAP